MKISKLLIATLVVLVAALPTFGLGIKINQLSCKGLGAVSGYTTIDLGDDNSVQITSTKYFITSSDSRVRITNSEILANGHVKLDLYSSTYNSRFYLVLSGSSGPASFVTAKGTDTLICLSNINAHN